MELDLAETPRQLSAAASLVWAWALAFLPRLGAAVALLAAGVFIGGWLARIVRSLIYRTPHIDDTVAPILGAAVRYAVLILFVIAALGQLGVQTASLLAVLGAAGLAIGLALQGTLQNIAAGIMLIYLRPFRVGDTIETALIAGTVREIGLFATQLETGDGLFFFAPNSSLWNTPLRNFTRNPKRQMTVRIGIAYGSDPEVARRVLLAMAGSDRRVLKDPAPAVYIDAYGENSMSLVFQAWSPTSVFGDVQRAMTEQAKTRLEAAGVEIAFPQRVVVVPSASREDVPASRRKVSEAVVSPAAPPRPGTI